jgi:hypothetical protein
MARTCPKPAYLRDSWMKFQQSWSSSWASPVWGGRPRPPEVRRTLLGRVRGTPIEIGGRGPRSTSLRAGPPHTNLSLTMPTRTKTSPRRGTKKRKRHASLPRQNTTRSITSPSSSLREEKGLAWQKFRQKVKHPKYGEGTVYHREGEGEEAKITVQFPRFGMKKLVEKYAQLEKG